MKNLLVMSFFSPQGEAIAQYAEANMRIPRRGEVGWQGDEIERLEGLGYVMSGAWRVRACMGRVRVRDV